MSFRLKINYSRMNRRLCCALICFACSLIASANEIDSLLFQLDETMDDRAVYENAKVMQIQRMKGLLGDVQGDSVQTYLTHDAIIDAYLPYTFDSALHYIDLNLKLSKALDIVPYQNETTIKLAGLLTSSGRYKEAFDFLNDINEKGLPDAQKAEYYAHLMDVSADLSIYNQVKGNAERYKRIFQGYRDSLAALVEPNSEVQLAIIEQQFRNERQFDHCLKINDKRLAKVRIGTRSYSFITYQRSLAYEMMGNREQQKKYLILSAISDIKASVKDNASLSLLALLLYEEGDIDRAYKYVKFSFEDVEFFNSRLRFIQISNILPVITAAYQRKSDRQKATLRMSLVVISLLSLVLLLAILFINRQVKKIVRAKTELQQANDQLKILNDNLSEVNNQLNGANNQLSESNHVKEHYIGTFFSICSNYIDKLDTFRRMVNRGIADHEVADLFEKTKSRRMIDDEVKQFYENFDDTFLKIYPDFVPRFNALLMESEQILLKKGELLNTELRIFALIRLGITDSSKIAKLLRYSVNTIYNYRVKVKNKAVVPRDNFEEYVTRIGGVEN